MRLLSDSWDWVSDSWRFKYCICFCQFNEKTFSPTWRLHTYLTISFWTRFFHVMFAVAVKLLAAEGLRLVFDSGCLFFYSGWSDIALSVPVELLKVVLYELPIMKFLFYFPVVKTYSKCHFGNSFLQEVGAIQTNNCIHFTFVWFLPIL